MARKLIHTSLFTPHRTSTAWPQPAVDDGFRARGAGASALRPPRTLLGSRTRGIHDEPFHVNQTQKYCAGQLREWDPKITTFPGLYVFAALPSWIGAAVGLSGAPAWCTLSYLRGLNLLPALATPYLLLLLIRRLHPNTSPSDALANAVLLSLAPTHFFYHFLYYTDSLATVSALALLAIVMPARAERCSRPGRTSKQLSTAACVTAMRC